MTWTRCYPVRRSWMRRSPGRHARADTAVDEAQNRSLSELRPRSSSTRTTITPLGPAHRDSLPPVASHVFTSTPPLMDWLQNEYLIGCRVAEAPRGHAATSVRGVFSRIGWATSRRVAHPRRAAAAQPSATARTPFTHCPHRKPLASRDARPQAAEVRRETARSRSAYTPAGRDAGSPGRDRGRSRATLEPSLVGITPRSAPLESMSRTRGVGRFAWFLRTRVAAGTGSSAMV